VLTFARVHELSAKQAFAACHDCFEHFTVDIGKGNGDATPGQGPGDAQANPACAAGDECMFCV
jgi:hypothetical protein